MATRALFRTVAEKRNRPPQKPIGEGVAAVPFRPIYGMHRYFARRPHNLFEKLIDYYVPENGVVLDPFMGGGVTLVEALLQDKRSIGIDINPLAGFICDAEISDWPLEEVDVAFHELERRVANKILELYGSRCKSCGHEVPASWIEWSSVLKCEVCRLATRTINAKKLGAGTWECSHCANRIRFTPEATTIYRAVNVHTRCTKCGVRDTRVPRSPDWESIRLAQSRLVDQRKLLRLPAAAIPDNNMQRESALHKKGFKFYSQLFSDRNLYANALLFREIEKLKQPIRTILLFIFSSSLRYTNRMVTRNPAWRKDDPLEWVKPGFWIPPVQLEANVWEQFSKRFKVILRAKRSLQPFLPSKPVLGNVSEVLSKLANIALITDSSTRVPLPDESVDAVITDPPYGNYVHYADLSNFWLSWLRQHANAPSGLAPTHEEAVSARKLGFPGAKSIGDYMNLLTKCFGECHRVLRSDGWLVLTFHNREPRAWIAVMEAIVRAGFILPDKAVIFQDGIANYKHTAQSRRAGSAIGDFVYSFRKRSARLSCSAEEVSGQLLSKMFMDCVEDVLGERGPCTGPELWQSVYLKMIPTLYNMVVSSVGKGAQPADVLTLFDEVFVFDSHRGALLKERFNFDGRVWSIASNG